MKREVGSRYEAQERQIAVLLRLPRELALSRLKSEAADRESWVSYGTAEICKSGADFGKALVHFQEARHKDPESPLARAGYAFLYEDGEARLSTIMSLAQQWPSLARLRLYTGLALAGVGRHGEAMAQLREAAEMNPEDIEVWGAIAQASLRLGDRRAARDAAQQVLSLGREAFRWHAYAARIFLRARCFRLGFRTARRAARAFSDPRAPLLPWTLPYQVAKPRLILVLNIAVAVAALFALFALSKAVLGPFAALALLIPMGLFLVWEALGYFASDRSRLVRMSREFLRIKSEMRSQNSARE